MADAEVPLWLKTLPLAPEFHPTEAEFEDPMAYILKIEPQASQYGICKIVPPFPKPRRRVVLNNLNNSLASSLDKPSCNVQGSDAPMARSMGPMRSMSGRSASVEVELGGKAKFTTRLQQLGLNPKRPRASQTHKVVWQSGESYTIEQFETKAKLFYKSRLGTVREVPALIVESLFWKAAGEKAISIEYANDIPGSAFAPPTESVSFPIARGRKRTRVLEESIKNSRVLEAGSKRLKCTDEILKDESAGEEEGSSLKVSEEVLGLDNEGDPGKATAEEIGVGVGCKLANSAWNMRNVARSPGSLLRHMPDEVPGVTSPMVYIGMLFSWFAWHVEDHELHSLNYLHMGAPKTWYAVPGRAAPALEASVQVHGYGSQLDARDSFARLGEKTTVMSPEVLVSAGVPCCRLVQNAGEYVVTFPRAYHLGFSHGFNCGEAANFATPGWLDVARDAAARRAAMNYLPMLSHQQLLYLLAMSLPSSSVLDARTQPVKGKNRQGEEKVKTMFVNDIHNHNRLLGELFDHGISPCLMLSAKGDSAVCPPTLLPTITLPSIDNGIQNVTCTSDGEKQAGAPLQLDDAVPDGDTLAVPCTDAFLQSEPGPISGHHGDHLECQGPYRDRSNTETADVKARKSASARDPVENNPVTSSAPFEWGTLPCAACGILCYAGMAVVHPSKTAAASFTPMLTPKLKSYRGSYFPNESGENGTTGIVSAKADTKSADFHMLPSAGLQSQLDFDVPTMSHGSLQPHFENDADNPVTCSRIEEQSDTSRTLSDTGGSFMPKALISFTEGEVIPVEPLSALQLLAAAYESSEEDENDTQEDSLRDDKQEIMISRASCLDSVNMSGVALLKLTSETTTIDHHLETMEQQLLVKLEKSYCTKTFADAASQFVPTAQGLLHESFETSLKRAVVSKLRGSGQVFDDLIQDQEVPCKASPTPYETLSSTSDVALCQKNLVDGKHRGESMVLSASIHEDAAAHGGELVSTPDNHKVLIYRDEVIQETENAAALGDAHVTEVPICDSQLELEEYGVGNTDASNSTFIDRRQDGRKKATGPDLSLGVCVMSRSAHDSFFDSFDDLTNGNSPEKAKVDGYQLASEVLGNCQGDINLGCQKNNVSAVILDLSAGVCGASTFDIESEVESRSENAGSANETASNLLISGKAGGLEAQTFECGTVAVQHSSEITTGIKGYIQEGSDKSADTLTLVDVSLKPRVLCLEHAVDAQQRLESVGGAYVLVVCHSDFMNVELRAKGFSAEEGFDNLWRTILYRKATKEELSIINAASEIDEPNELEESDWVAQLGLSPNNCRAGDTIENLCSADVKGHARRVAKQLKEKKGLVVGTWCGRDWRAEHLHPLLGGSCSMELPPSSSVWPGLFPQTVPEPILLGTSRARKVVRPCRLADYTTDGRLSKSDIDTRKPGRKRKNLEFAAGFSEDEGRARGNVVTVPVTGSNYLKQHLRQYLGVRGNTRRGTGLENGRSRDLRQAPLKWVKAGTLRQKAQAAAAKRLVAARLSRIRTRKAFRIDETEDLPLVYSTQQGALTNEPQPSPVWAGVNITSLEEQGAVIAPVAQEDNAVPNRDTDVSSLIPFSQVSVDDKPGSPELLCSQPHLGIAEVGKGLSPFPAEPSIHNTMPLPSNSEALMCHEKFSPIHTSCEDNLIFDKTIWSQVPVVFSDSFRKYWSSMRKLAQIDQDQSRHHIPCASPAYDLCPVEVEGADDDATNRLQPCPDSTYQSAPRKCYSDTEIFTQKGTSSNSIQSLATERCAPALEPGPSDISTAELGAGESVLGPRLTPSELVSVMKRKHELDEVEVAKKLKVSTVEERNTLLIVHMEKESLDFQVNGGAVLTNLLTNKGSSNVKVTGGSDVTGLTGAEGDMGTEVNLSIEPGQQYPCSMDECSRAFESDEMLQVHRHMCHVLLPQTPDLHQNPVSNMCTEFSPKGLPEEHINAEQGSPLAASNVVLLQSTEPLVATSGRRWVGKARGRRTKSFGWKSCLHFLPSSQTEQNCQLWDRKPLSYQKQPIDHTSVVEVSTVFNTSGFLTSTGTRVRRRRMSGPGVVKWEGGMDNDDEDSGFVEVDENFKKEEKRKKVRKAPGQKQSKVLEGEYQCDVDGCTMGFDTEQDLQLHKKNRCTWKGCGKHFHMHKYLLQHRRVHLDERPLKCPWEGCTMAFKWAWARTEHIRVHTGERPYKCTVANCGQTFRFVSDFSRHKRNTGHKPA